MLRTAGGHFFRIETLIGQTMKQNTQTDFDDNIEISDEPQFFDRMMSYSIYEALNLPLPEYEVEQWTELVDHLRGRSTDKLDSKSKAQLISPARLKKNTTRSDANVVSWDFFVIDIDYKYGCEKPDDILPDIEKKLQQYEYVINSTGSNKRNRPVEDFENKDRGKLILNDLGNVDSVCLRVVIPFDRTLRISEIQSVSGKSLWRNLWKILIDDFDVNADLNCKDESRCYVMPADFLGAVNVFHHHCGSPIRVDPLVNQVCEKVSLENSQETSNSTVGSSPKSKTSGSEQKPTKTIIQGHSTVHQEHVVEALTAIGSGETLDYQSWRDMFWALMHELGDEQKAISFAKEYVGENNAGEYEKLALDYDCDQSKHTFGTLVYFAQQAQSGFVSSYRPTEPENGLFDLAVVDQLKSSLIANVVSGPSGCGKTYNLLKYLDKECRTTRHKAIVIQISKSLNEQSHVNAVHNRGVSYASHLITEINENTVRKGQVLKSISEHLKQADPEKPEILFITHQSFLAMQTNSLISDDEDAVYIKEAFRKRKSHWNVYVDETMDIVEDLTRSLKRSHGFFFEYFDVKDSDLPSFYRATSKIGRTSNKEDNAFEGLRDLATNRDQEDTMETFRDLSNTIFSEHAELYIRKKNYHSIQDVSNSDSKKLFAYKVIKPRVFEDFKSVTILAANFSDSLMMKIFDFYGVRFNVQHEIQSACDQRMKSHPNGHLLNIYYFFEENWSKSFRDDDSNTDVDKLDFMKKQTVSSFPKLLWQGNKDIPDDFFDDVIEPDPDHEGEYLQDIVRLPNNPHGLNKFQSYDNVVFLSALNPNEQQANLFKEFGLDAEEIRTAIAYETCYQSINRTSLRDTASETEKNVIVTDRPLASYLQNLFMDSADPTQLAPILVTKKPRGRPLLGERKLTTKETSQRNRDKKKRLNGKSS
ncbi:MAG: hypothetical protein HON65_07495 [Rhodospirillales bacterium]|nr:hypothetical protein [Rhodospirillales bacterium]